MADLNRLMSEIQRESTDINKSLKSLFIKYETLHKEGSRIYKAERVASDSMEGLESFHRLVQTVRRNRDVVGSLLRGHSNLRSISDFKFVEEDIPVEKPKAAKRKRPKPQPIFDTEPELVEVETETAASEEIIQDN